MKALVLDNEVVQVELNEFPVHPSMVWMDCPDNTQAGWILLNGALQPKPVPELTQAQLIELMVHQVKNYLHKTAVDREYESELSILTYVSSKKARWKNEADVYASWRDDVWEKSYQILAEVEAGTRQAPTPEQFLAELPTIVWPA